MLIPFRLFLCFIVIYLHKVKIPERCNTKAHSVGSDPTEAYSKSNLPVIIFNWLAPLRDRYNNAKSVTIPLPTRVRQTPGALPADRKPGCKPLPHLHCSTRVSDSQWFGKRMKKVLLIAQFPASHTHFRLRFRHFHHRPQRSYPHGAFGRYGCR